MRDAAGEGIPEAMPRPTGYIVEIAGLELLPYLSASHQLTAVWPLVTWAAVSGFLTWKIWQGDDAAWLILLMLNFAYLLLILLAPFNVVKTGHGDLWLFCQAAAEGVEVSLLLTPRMRRWVGRTRSDA